MAIGYLLIQSRTAHDAVPLSGVQVRITDIDSNILYELTTDENGETPVIALNTIDKSFSQTPYYNGLPFTSYSVLAKNPGFNSLFVSDIPIYDGETAVLPVVLTPMQQTQRQSATQTITIGKPAVAMRDTSEQEGTYMEPRILRQVVIPNPITVHLGTPSSNAKNVQVSFPEYVKNVASSEIYPTWPQNSLTANIYAIITFALNRIYTEWYRSRGYNFDITNSTAYDQYFVEGRPIYSSISRIVDDIFNEYVRRQGHIAPYFTSFCNGTTATCQGLSQWGTVTLAEQGLTPIQILRSYYPDDVEIAETEVVTGILSSYPGTPLRVGSTGLDVQTIQTYLNRIRRNYPAIPAITDEEGVFQDSTRAAVTKFQNIFNLTPDGIVGKSTWYKISSLYTAVARLAELDSEGGSIGIGTVPPGSILRQGSSGPDVITLQYLLDLISEYYPEIPGLAQDGIFGSGTRQSVIAFQKTMSLNADGIVGPLTWKALYDTYRGIIQNVPSQKPDGNPDETDTFQYTVQPGDTLWLLSRRYGTTVEAIRRLNGLTGDILYIGQVIRIPVSSTGGYREYIVQAGDSLWLLSRRFGTTVEAIMQLNGLTSDLIDVGQVLKIPLS